MDEFFSKAGIIRLDFKTGEKKIKIYTDDQGNPKGDGLVSYQRPESKPAYPMIVLTSTTGVELAVDLLNESYIKPGYKVLIE